MSSAPPDDKAYLEGKLNGALDEAWSKLNRALEQTSKHSEQYEKDIWMAAEAVEYSSLLFNLTYGLDDLDPIPKDKKGEDALTLVRDSTDLFIEAREVRNKSSVEAYAKIRHAAHYLKRAYLNELKKTTKAKVTSTVRSKP